MRKKNEKKEQHKAALSRIRSIVSRHDPSYCLVFELYILKCEQKAQNAADSCGNLDSFTIYHDEVRKELRVILKRKEINGYVGSRHIHHQHEVEATSTKLYSPAFHHSGDAGIVFHA